MDSDKVTILRNPRLQKKTVKKLNTNSCNSQNNSNSKKVNEDDDIPKLNLVGKETGMKISQARLAKKFKQKDVANYMNMDASLYQKYENGTAPRNGQILNKLGRYLGVKLTGKGIK
jgi:ribosome-binding protein aMBF1 (putative translation factor)